MKKALVLIPSLLFAWPVLGEGTNNTKGPTKPVYQSYQEAARVDLERKAKELPELPDAAQRKDAFARRNDPEQIKSLADELFSLWDTREKNASRQPALTKTLNPAKEEVYRLYQDGKYQKALDAFRAYFFAKLKAILKDDKGLASRDYLNRASNEDARRNSDARISLAMEGIYQNRESKETVRLGEPGLTQWDYTSGGPKLWSSPTAPEFEYFYNSPFAQLWWRFMDTKDQKVLDRYLAYWDDYSLNHKAGENLNIGTLDAGKQGANNAFATFFAMSEIARHLPPGGDGYSSATLARQLIRFLKLELPQTLYYNREQSNNHSTGAIHNQLAVSNVLYDFLFAKVMEREARRQFETYGTLFDLPDGAMPGKNLGYAFHELQENLISIDRIRDYNYAWATPQWDREMTDRLMRRAFYILNLINPNGESVQLYKADWRNHPFDTYYIYPLSRALPRLWDVPGVSAISTRIAHNQTKVAPKGTPLMAANRPVAREGEGIQEGAEPPYTSISFPYTQTHIMRNGWDPQNSSYGVFGVNPGQGDSGGSFHNLKCSNILQIGGRGGDLLTNGVDAAYNFVPSPVLVDGLSQFAIANKGPSGRKGDSNEGLLPISENRIHHGSDFDVVEGFYHGMWADTIDHEPEFYDWKYRDEVAKKAVSGPTHRRVVHFVKDHGIWVVVDLLDAPGEHEYTQQFFMLHSLKNAPPAYQVEQFSVDQNALSLKSHAKDLPNLSLYYAGPATENLKISDVVPKQEVADKYEFSRNDRKRDKEFLHLKSSWRAKGTSLLITVLEGSGPGREGAPISEFQRKPDGFVAKLASGETLKFRAKLSENNPAGFESKLTLVNRKGVETGVVLGEKSYVFGTGRKETTPIHRPLRDLEITPGRNVFVDSTEVAVRSPDEDVEIRYTLDGRDPSLDSPLYMAPVRLTGSALFKARAFRKGITIMPANLVSGTQISRVFSAPFTKEELEDPTDKNPSEAQPGLNYQYFTAKWPRLLFGPPALKPVKEGVVQGAFDISPAEGSEQAFGFFYTGYLEVPEDGVYTFYAPDEFLKFRPLAGYDLTMWLGSDPTSKRKSDEKGANLTEWYPATGRHAFGTWSKALRKGLHPVRIYYANLRPGGRLAYQSQTYPELNVPGQTKTFFDGKVPVLEVSGPRIERQPIPVGWYKN